jgi:uncharacterized protein YecE (DUF72 family)
LRKRNKCQEFSFAKARIVNDNLASSLLRRGQPEPWRPPAGSGDMATNRRKTRTGQVRVGTSGWTYPPWRGCFFPKGLPQRQELAYAGSVFRAIEINGTFYGLQKPDSFARWAEATPDDFSFAVKAPRFITHILRLREAEIPLANFFASGVLRLGAKLGPILWQFPPSFSFDPVQMQAFLALLPQDTEAAAALAARHDGHLKGRAWLKTDRRRPLRHAVEIRHESFRDADFIDLLRAHDIALVCADTVEWPLLMDLTSDFVYCRLHGSEELYRSGYDDAALDRWAARVRAWAEGRRMRDGEFAGPQTRRSPPRDVFLFFDNTDKLRAPDDARALMQRPLMQRLAGSADPHRAAAPPQVEGRSAYVTGRGELG